MAAGGQSSASSPEPAAKARLSSASVWEPGLGRCSRPVHRVSILRGNGRGEGKPWSQPHGPERSWKEQIEKQRPGREPGQPPVYRGGSGGRGVPPTGGLKTSYCGELVLASCLGNCEEPVNIFSKSPCT